MYYRYCYRDKRMVTVSLTTYGTPDAAYIAGRAEYALRLDIGEINVVDENGDDVDYLYDPDPDGQDARDINAEQRRWRDIAEVGYIRPEHQEEHPRQEAIRPRIVCLCGSTRFSDAYQRANLDLTLDGNIVLTIGADMHSDAALFADKSPAELEAIKARLDALHLAKIDLADEVLILNVGGYVGESTRREIAYATAHSKIISWLEPEHALGA